MPPHTEWRTALEGTILGVDRARSQDARDERRFRIGVGHAIFRELRGEPALQSGVLCRKRWVGAQVISEAKMVAPEIAAVWDEVQVVRARPSTPEIVSSGNSRLSSILVAQPLQCIDVGAQLRLRRPTDHDVDDWLGDETGDRGTSNVFDLGLQAAERSEDSCSLCGELSGP